MRSARLAVRVIGSGLLRLEFIKTTVECPDVSNKRMRGREGGRYGWREGGMEGKMQQSGGEDRGKVVIPDILGEQSS